MLTPQLAGAILDVTDALMHLPQQLITSSQLRDKACTRFGCFHTLHFVRVKLPFSRQHRCEFYMLQDRQALLKAKYCPLVAAASFTRTQKNTKKNQRDLDLWPTIPKSNTVLEVVEIHVSANFIKLNAAVHELSCTQTFLTYLAMVKNQKIRSCDLDLWPMTLKFSEFWAVVKIHVRANLDRANCSGSLVIVVTEKKNSDENNTVVATADIKYSSSCNSQTVSEAAAASGKVPRKGLKLWLFTQVDTRRFTQGGFSLK